MSSSVEWLGKYMVNDQRYDREKEIQQRIDRNTAFAGSVREGFVTSLFLGDRWGNREGVTKFMDTDWNTKLGDIFDAMYEHYIEKGKDEWKLTLPKDYAELERVARLFRETYIAYFIWHCMFEVKEGYAPTVWHALADYVEEAHWVADKYPEVWGRTPDANPEAYKKALWEGFFERVYGRSRKFNFTNFVAANSMLSMLENQYYQETPHAYENVANGLEEAAKREEEVFQKRLQYVEDIINGTDNSREV